MLSSSFGELTDTGLGDHGCDPADFRTGETVVNDVIVEIDHIDSQQLEGRIVLETRGQRLSLFEFTTTAG